MLCLEGRWGEWEPCLGYIGRQPQGRQIALDDPDGDVPGPAVRKPRQANGTLDLINERVTPAGLDLCICQVGRDADELVELFDVLLAHEMIPPFGYTISMDWISVLSYADCDTLILRVGVSSLF